MYSQLGVEFVVTDFKVTARTKLTAVRNPAVMERLLQWGIVSVHEIPVWDNRWRQHC